MDFSRALEITLAAEGGYVNDPDDRGGATNYGVTQRTYDKWRARYGFEPRDVLMISDAEVDAIYLTYWDAAGADRYDWPLNAIMFDMAVNHGPTAARKILQRALGVTADGIVGPVTRGSMEALATDSLANEVLWARVGRYRQLSRTPGQVKFLAGWLWRVEHLRDELALNHIRRTDEDS